MFSQCPSVVQLALSSPLAASCIAECRAATGGASDFEDSASGPHTLSSERQPVSGIGLLPRRRMTLVLSMSSLLLRCQFFKANMKTIQVSISARILPQHNFLLLPELIHGDVCRGVQACKQVIYFIYRYVRRRSFAFCCE